MILKDNEKNHFEVQAQFEIKETYYLFLSDCTSVTCKQHIFLVHFAKIGNNNLYQDSCFLQILKLLCALL